MLVADEELQPEPGTLNGISFFEATPKEAERAATVSLWCSEPRIWVH
jgi:hypothetical protein